MRFSCKVHNRRGRASLEYSGHCGHLGYVTFNEFNSRVFEGMVDIKQAPRIRKLVEDNNTAVSVCQQVMYKICPDKSGATRYKNCFH